MKNHVMNLPTKLAFTCTALVLFSPDLVRAQSCEDQFIRVESYVDPKEDKRVVKFRKEAAKYFASNLKLPDGNATIQLQLILLGETVPLRPVTVEEIVLLEPQAANSARGKILAAYTKFVRTYQRPPSEAELAKPLDLTEAELVGLLGQGRLFDSLQIVRDKAADKNPRLFDKVVDTRFLDAAAMARTEQVIRESETLLVTTAVPYTPVNENMLATLKVMAKRKKAKIVVIPAFMQTTGLDPKLLNDPDIHILVNTTVLSSQLRLDTIKIMPKMVNPDAGLDRYGPRGQSVVVAAPQVRLKTVSTIDNDSFPHFVMTTGAITEGIYNTRLPIQGRTDALAADRHNLAVLLVEKTRGVSASSIPGVSSSGFYNFRHIHYVEGKGMVDKNTLYTPLGYVNAKILALVLPDIHVGKTDPRFLESIAEAIKKLKPRFIVIHDLFDGRSISHHDAKKVVESAQEFLNGKLSLESELRDTATFLNSILRLDPNIEVRIILSNHDLWLNRWLSEGAFMKDTHNRALGIELAAVMVKKQSPFEYALNMSGLEYPKRVTFVTEGSWNVAGVQLGQHGHQGADGARGSLLTMARAADKSSFGHSHKSQIIGHTVNVGTGSLLRMGYNGSGPSSWSHSIGAVSETGVTQLFIAREGQFWSNGSIGNDPTFFEQGFPKVVPTTDPNLGPQIDQYSRSTR